MAISAITSLRAPSILWMGGSGICGAAGDASQTDVKPAEPERGCHKYECPEHVPCECLLKTFILDCAESRGRTFESVRMMNGEV
jgi:hypothetical protein